VTVWCVLLQIGGGVTEWGALAVAETWWVWRGSGDVGGESHDFFVAMPACIITAHISKKHPTFHESGMWLAAFLGFFNRAMDDKKTPFFLFEMLCTEQDFCLHEMGHRKAKQISMSISV